ncbi:hypothetical protein [Algoriphagus sp. CAU 1675]|uniref:hypothetical protein n=1 Tax=Algoriphagus sp. CAU 1675 TaxID=3032597 RepID=UPI0023DA6FB6|nr:hypothetical protein [Algoriphagus sp. CAU 1675]MDF2156588.1 hypothetical protein [Algoriphagus sp. CAU 1675]
MNNKGFTYGFMIISLIVCSVMIYSAFAQLGMVLSSYKNGRTLIDKSLQVELSSKPALFPNSKRGNIILDVTRVLL